MPNSKSMLLSRIKFKQGELGVLKEEEKSLLKKITDKTINVPVTASTAIAARAEFQKRKNLITKQLERNHKKSLKNGVMPKVFSAEESATSIGA